MTTITFHSDNTSRQRREAMMFGLLRVAAGINILALVGSRRPSGLRKTMS